MTETNAEDIRICFVGDSFVNGTEDETALGWAGRLCAAAMAKGVPLTYYNLGIRRETTADILLRWEKECRCRLPKFCDGRIVFSCGVNDVTEENGKPRVEHNASCSNLREILVEGRKYPSILVGPPPVDDDMLNDRIERLSKSFADIAESLDVPYIELYSSLIGDKVYRSEVAKQEGSHPRSGGYKKIAKIIAASPAWWFR